MSKAFTKEDNSSENEDLIEDGTSLEETATPSGFKNYITPLGAERLQTELKDLLHVQRPKVVNTVSWAAGNGDRSENGDYIYGKRRLREIDRRIRFLTKRLESAEVIDPAAQKSTEVLFGATVTFADEEERKKTVRIVGIDESAPEKGDISWISPLAKALLHAKVGDIINFHSPRGEEDLEIISIQYITQKGAPS